MRWRLVLVMCAFLPATSASAGQPEWWRAGGPRLRPEPRIARLLEEGRLRSATLHSLLERIETGDVFVYITVNRLMDPRLAGTVQWMASAGSFRYLRVSIDPNRPTHQVIATLGHELQHVVEVSGDPSVVGAAARVALYKRIGRPALRTVGACWESEAALLAGEQVRRELMAAPASAARLQDPSKRDRSKE